MVPNRLLFADSSDRPASTGEAFQLQNKQSACLENNAIAFYALRASSRIGRAHPQKPIDFREKDVNVVRCRTRE
jgi:hypothetical protein